MPKRKFTQYKIDYEQNFVHIKNIANSPQSIIDSFSHLPFITHNKQMQLLSADTDNVSVMLYYRKLNEDMWLFVSEIKSKRNILTTNLYDNSAPVLFNFINFHIKEEEVVGKSVLINGTPLINQTWSLQKAGSVRNLYHFKNSVEKNITLYFTNTQIKHLLQTHKPDNGKLFSEFIKSKKKNLLFSQYTKGSEEIYTKLLKLVKSGGDNKKVVAATRSFCKQFFEVFKLHNSKKERLLVSEKTYEAVVFAEELLKNNIQIGFPGIIEMANEIGVSSTKLKADFKKIHHQSLYQYFSSIQMQLAKQMLSKKNVKVAEVAKDLGYNSIGKFSTKFFKEYKIMPSELIKSVV